MGGLSGMAGFGGTAFGQAQPQAGAGVGTGAQAGGNPAGAGFGGAGAGAGGMDLNSLLQGLNAGGQGGAGAGFGGAGAGGMDLNSLLQGLNAGGQGGAGAGAGYNLANFMPPQQQTNPNLAPEERYREQLQQMSDMGFTNKDLNIQMLDATGGNVQLAIERLLSMLG
jgi:ubiquilin